MTIAYVALGANLPSRTGDASSTLTRVFDDLAHLPGTKVAARSALYRTAPVNAAGPDFINAAAALDTALDAPALLAALLAIEQSYGRTRPHAQSGPAPTEHAARTLDLDLLLHGDSQVNTPYLTLPHPRMHVRAFVLVPLAQIAPQLIIPGQGRVIDHLETVGRQGVSSIPD